MGTHMGSAMGLHMAPYGLQNKQWIKLVMHYKQEKKDQINMLIKLDNISFFLHGAVIYACLLGKRPDLAQQMTTRLQGTDKTA